MSDEGSPLDLGSALSPGNPFVGTRWPEPTLPARSGPRGLWFACIALVAAAALFCLYAALIWPLHDPELAGAPPLLRLVLGILGLALLALAGWIVADALTTIEVDAEGVTERRHVRERVTRIRWDEVRSFDLRMIPGQEAVGGFEIRADDGRTVEVSRHLSCFAAAGYLLWARVLPRLVDEALRRLEAGERLGFPLWRPVGSHARRARGSRDRIELDATSIRHARRGLATEIRWRDVEAWELGGGASMLLESAHERIVFDQRRDDALLLHLLTAELVLRHRPRLSARAAQAQGLRRTERGVRWMGLAMLGLAAIALGAELWPWLRLEAQVHDLDAFHARLLEEGVPASGTVREVRGEGRVTVVLGYEHGGAVFEYTDVLCGATPAVGDSLVLIVLPRHPEAAVLEQSCQWNPEVRRRVLGRATLAALVKLSPHALVFGGMWAWAWLRFRRMLRTAGREAPDGATLAP